MIWFLSSLFLATSIEPLRLLVQDLAGNHVEVFALIPPGASPHTYDPRPTDFARLEKAHAVILVGPPLDHWVHHRRRVVLKTLLGIPDTANPHIWLSFRHAKRIAQSLTDSLTRWDPEHAETFRKNLQNLLARLDSLEQTFRTRVSEVRPVVVYHPAWSYVFKELGIPVVGVVERHPGVEPSPKALAGLIRAIRRSGARILVLEPAASTALLHTLLAETRLDTVTLDPLGGILHPASFPDFLEQNLERLFRARTSSR